jgi:hypothetical protein
MDDSHKKIAKKLENTDGFLPYIDEIRFPMYKMLDEDLRISLNWPITALIGPNGTNKSSILQAISAAPEGRSLAQFWFSTEVDDIDRGPRGKASHRFVYKYRFDGSGVVAECRKYRGSKRYRSTDVPRLLRGQRDPDYWEPTKRVDSDGMAPIPSQGFDNWVSRNRDRWNQIKKEVVYLDFRSELSAFDKYIHHQSFSRYTPDATQKRYKTVINSKWIARALCGENLPKGQRSKLLGPARELDPMTVAAISDILGKPIVKIVVIHHKFFGPDGYTVQLHLGGNGAPTYSEAHAGSGEYAVVRLVDVIQRAHERSLILLDEPEVSLHPGAQVKLMNFLGNEVLRRGHQVVISTHSPALASVLPPQAIKVLGYDIAKHRVVLLADSCSPTEAFVHLGHTTVGTQPRLIVEDKLAAEIARAALRRHAPTKLDALEIVPFPGGADGLVANVLSSLAMGGFTNAGVLLDGDQAPQGRDTSLDVFKQAKALGDDVDALKNLWRENFHDSKPNLFSNSDHGQDAAVLRSCLQWASAHLGYLPGAGPEQSLAAALGENDLDKSAGQWKSYWIDRTKSKLHLTEAEAVTSAQVLAVQQAELASLAADSTLLTGTYSEIARIIDW